MPYLEISAKENLGIEDVSAYFIVILQDSLFVTNLYMHAHCCQGFCYAC